jgi:hypothetical protein
MEEISSFKEKCGVIRVHLRDPFSLLLGKILGNKEIYAIGIYYIDENLTRTILYYEETGQVVNWILTFSTLLESPSIQSIHIMKFPFYRQTLNFCRNLKQAILNINGTNLIDDFFVYKQVWLREPFTNTGYKLVNLICNNVLGLIGPVSETTLIFNVNETDARLFVPLRDPKDLRDPRDLRDPKGTSSPQKVDRPFPDKTVYRQELDFILHHTRQEFASLFASFIDLYLYSNRFQQRVLMYRGEDFLSTLTDLLNTKEIDQTIFLPRKGDPIRREPLHVKTRGQDDRSEPHLTLKNGYIRVKPYPNLGKRLRNFVKKIFAQIDQGKAVSIDLKELLIISDLLNGDRESLVCQEDVCYNSQNRELIRFTGPDSYTKVNLFFEEKTYPGVIQTNFLEETTTENSRTILLTDYGTEDDLQKLTTQEIKDTLNYLNRANKLLRLQEKLRLELADRDINRTIDLRPGKENRLGLKDLFVETTRGEEV